MNEMINCEIEMEDKELSKLLDLLKDIYNDNQDTFAELSFTIHKIWTYCKNNYWKAKNNELYNSYKLLAKFGFDKKAVSRYKTCFERFVDGDTIFTVSLTSRYYDFAPSKLFEMLTLSNETLENAIDNKLIRPDMTVKQIREIIKTIKDGTDKVEKVLEDSSVTEINEEEIPLVYNPKQEYEYSYFESKTKNQLLNIVWQLQTEYQKLKKKGEKKKNEHN